MRTDNCVMAILAVASALLTAPSCDHKGNHKSASSGKGTTTADSVLMLTRDQIVAAGIETGKMEYRDMTSVLECNGNIEAPPENIADVTVPIGGLVKSCPFHPGDYVSAGQLIAVLEHPDYIKIQQDFLETKSQWEFYKEDFKRQGELTVENAASVKTMQQAQASFRSTEVKMFALRSQLKLLGINTDSLTIENISSTINIAAPISGYITDIKTNIGKYVGPEQGLCEILNKTNLHLKLYMNEKNINRIKTGQSIEFFLTSDPGKRYQASVSAISPKIVASNNAYIVYARISKAQPFFNPGMSVTAFISNAGNSCLSLPLTAIVMENDEQMVFTQTSNVFARFVIKTGVTDNDRVEVIDYPPGLSDSAIVIKGTDFLNAAWNNRK